MCLDSQAFNTYIFRLFSVQFSVQFVFRSRPYNVNCGIFNDFKKLVDLLVYLVILA
jgi:hypothetical protein